MNVHQFGALLAAIYVGIGLSGICVWAMLIHGWRRNGTLLPYAIRPPAPWGPIGLAVAVIYAWTALEGAWTSVGNEPPEKITNRGIVAFASACLIAALATQIWIWLVNDGTRRDLGWPTSCREWAFDIGFGSVGAVALIGPVHAILATLVIGFDLESNHHLIEAFRKNPDVRTALAICFAAVIAAPIFEEILFRQLAQGWLERLEDEMLAWRRCATQDNAKNDLCDESATKELGETIDADSPHQSAPPSRSIGGVPYGWWPILFSSTLFSLAHVGQGVAPIALFILAVGLGVIYQRTHRIVPCIVLHMLFNAYSMVLVGLSMLVEK